MFVWQGVSGVSLADDGEGEEELEDSEDEERPDRYCVVAFSLKFTVANGCWLCFWRFVFFES